jgi:hypothetical protein
MRHRAVREQATSREMGAAREDQSMKTGDRDISK